jgi:hypothetical protein
VLLFEHHLCQNLSMSRRSHLFKDTDYETKFWCAGGWGVLREEVWVDEGDEVIFYNLAFLLPHLTSIDNGRILGFDNAHGVHERHFMGEVLAVDFRDYDTTSRRFFLEVETLRRSYGEAK